MDLGLDKINVALEPGIPSVKEEQGGYVHSESLEGSKSFALWPLSQASQSCFGHDAWPNDLPIPQAWLEFDVENVQKATIEFETRLSRSRQKQKGTVGSDRDSATEPGRPLDRTHLHSVDAE